MRAPAGDRAARHPNRGRPTAPPPPGAESPPGRTRPRGGVPASSRTPVARGSPAGSPRGRHVPAPAGTLDRPGPKAGVVAPVAAPGVSRETSGRADDHAAVRLLAKALGPRALDLRHRVVDDLPLGRGHRPQLVVLPGLQHLLRVKGLAVGADESIQV